MLSGRDYTRAGMSPDSESEVWPRPSRSSESQLRAGRVWCQTPVGERHVMTGCLRSLCGDWWSAFDPPGRLVGIDFRQRLGQVEVNIVQIHLPLFDPASRLDAFIAFLPFLGFCIEFLL